MSAAMHALIERRLPLIAALALLCALHALALLRAPAGHHPARIAVTLAVGETIVLGRDELAAPGAAARQLALRRAPDGSWWLRNLQPQRPLMLHRDGAASASGRSVLRSGQQLRIGSGAFSVRHAHERGLSLYGAGQEWTYDGATLRRNGAVQPPCPGMAAGALLGYWWNRLAPRVIAIGQPLVFGGNLHCANRIGIPYLDPASASVQDRNGAMVLRADAPIAVDGADPQAAEIRLASLEAIGIGRSRFGVQVDGARAQLAPQRDVSLFEDRASSAAPLPPQVAWTWTQRDPWALPGRYGGAVVLSIGCAALLAARRYPAAVAATITLAGVAAMALQRSGIGVGIGCMLLLAWAALWCFVLLPRRLGAAGAIGVLLLASGLLLQLELGLGAPSAHWLRHAYKTCALLAVGLGAGALLRLRRPAIAARRQVELGLAALAIAALCALLLQVLLGDETGVFDLQPVEFAKLALAALSAHCLAVGVGWHAGLPETESRLRRWLRLGAPALLLGALSALALIGVNDFSPLLLLLVWCGAMTLAWAALSGRRALAAGLLAAALLGGAGIATLQGSASDSTPVTASDFYGERFAVWRDPAAHPHTGQQMLLAGRAIGTGRWWGSAGWLGIGSLGQPVGSVLALPAVQDDFAPAFLIHRHGLVAALILWLLQACFLAALVRTAASCWQRAAAARDFRLAWQGRFQGLFLCGGAAFVFGHLLLSWGTNLAILPIMGQPMSFLSAGGSHLLFFICPLLVASALGQASASAPIQASSAPAGRTHPRRVDHAGLCTT